MIRVTVEMLPATPTKTRSTLGTLDIVNVHNGDPVSDYVVRAQYGTGAMQEFTVRHSRHHGWLGLVRHVIITAAIRFGLPADLEGDGTP